MTSNGIWKGRLLSKQAWAVLSGRLRLSQREVPILRGLMNDQSEAQIATQLEISAHTVHSHIKRLYRKLGVTSRNALTARIFEEYLSMERSAGTGLDSELRQEEEPVGDTSAPDERENGPAIVN